MDGSSPTRQGDEQLYRILDTRRKNTFKAIIDSLPSWVGDAEPTMPKIRVSRGLLKWIESGGDTLETSLYLGNSLLTALRNYVPRQYKSSYTAREYATIKIFSYLSRKGTFPLKPITKEKVAQSQWPNSLTV